MRAFGRLLAEDARIFEPLGLYSGLGHGSGLTGSTSENQSWRVWAMSSMVLAWLRPRAVVMKSAQPLFSQYDRREIGPAGGVARRPFGERDAVGRRAHRGVVAVRAQHLPRRPILEADGLAQPEATVSERLGRSA